uniref:Uncharacterized protein n=1 Tax=Rhizophora mucronata TaxID=61149 RepID=A0A2P2N902_RHIMU
MELPGQHMNPLPQCPPTSKRNLPHWIQRGVYWSQCATMVKIPRLLKLLTENFQVNLQLNKTFSCLVTRKDV